MKRLILLTIASILNFGILLVIIIFSIRELYKLFLFLTILSYTLSTFYLVVMWIFEILIHRSRHDHDKHHAIKKNIFYVTMRERVFKFVFTASLTVCVSYWILCLGGPYIMDISQGTQWALNLWLHFLIGIQVMLELCLSEREHSYDVYLKDIFITIGLVTIYSIFLVYADRQFNLDIYPFLKLEYYQIFAINLMINLINFNIYQLYHYILERKRQIKKVNYETSLLYSETIIIKQ